MNRPNYKEAYDRNMAWLKLAETPEFMDFFLRVWLPEQVEAQRCSIKSGQGSETLPAFLMGAIDDLKHAHAAAVLGQLQNDAAHAANNARITASAQL